MKIFYPRDIPVVNKQTQDQNDNNHRDKQVVHLVRSVSLQNKKKLLGDNDFEERYIRLTEPVRFSVDL